MPAVNLQTWVLTNSDQPLRQVLSSFFKNHTLFEMGKGTLPRSIHRAVFWGLTFYANNRLFANNPISEQKDHKELEHKTPKKAGY